MLLTVYDRIGKNFPTQSKVAEKRIMLTYAEYEKRIEAKNSIILNLLEKESTMMMQIDQLMQ